MVKAWVSFWLGLTICTVSLIGAITYYSLESMKNEAEITREAMKNGYVQEPISQWGTSLKWTKKDKE